MTPRANNFDLMRFVLASAVVFSHCWPIAGGAAHEAWEPIARLSGGRLTIGAVSVDAFFVISGCLVSQSWDRSGGTIDFMRKRVRRVYPAFLVMSALTAFVVAPLFTEHLRRYTAHDLGLLTFDAVDLVEYGYPHGGGLPLFEHNPLRYSINSSLWTVRFEFVCYVLLATAGLLGALRKRWFPIAVFVVAWAFYIANLDIYTPRLALASVGKLSVWPRLLAFFFAGVVWHRNDCRASPWVVIVSALALVVSLPIGVAARAVLPIALPVILFALAGVRGTANRFGGRGDFSYGIYIYGFMVQQIVVALLPGLSVLGLFAVAWPATLFCGVVSWYVVERRFLHRNRGAEPLRPAVLSG